MCINLFIDNYFVWAALCDDCVCQRHLSCFHLILSHAAGLLLITSIYWPLQWRYQLSNVILINMD